MNVNVVDGGRAAFNSLLYNVPCQNTINWLNNNINTATEALKGVADNLVDASVNLYNRVNSNAAINAAKALVSEAGGHINPYVIYGLNMGSIPQANFIMQQYIMANPLVQDLYHDNMCIGFEETYFDTEPGIQGKDRFDYQRVDDGVLYECGDHMAVNYYSNSDETEISIIDQHLILDSWGHVEAMLLNGNDPTDPDGGEL